MIHTIDLHFQHIPQTIAAFVVESATGIILIETGPHSTLPALTTGIEQLGYRLADVRQVLLTHIHLDHAGASWAFAEQGADIYVHPLGYDHLKDPGKLMESAGRIYGDEMDRLWGQMNPIAESRLKTVGHGEQIHIGGHRFTAWHTPGHAKHHIAWQMGASLFAGDVAGVKILEGPVVPPCPPPDIDIEVWKGALTLLRNLPLESIFLTHFGEVNDWKVHLDELETVLDNWANWILPHFQAGRRAEEIIPEFEAFVHQSLREAGLTQEGLEKYELSNPSWMSVAGLLRYWKKKMA